MEPWITNGKADTAETTPQPKAAMTKASLMFSSWSWRKKPQSGSPTPAEMAAESNRATRSPSFP